MAQTVLILGGTSGTGLASAGELSRAGFRAVATGRHPEQPRQAREGCEHKSFPHVLAAQLAHPRLEKCGSLTFARLAAISGDMSE
jgi:NAD(P)-dependent dehydrogenase (short-subunit alcohol dehydrogenase family)